MDDSHADVGIRITIPEIEAIADPESVRTIIAPIVRALYESR
jgi:hypothetical protein